MEPIIVTAVAWILIIIGLVGTILPGLPGTGLVFGGIALYAFYFGVGETMGTTTFILLFALTLFSFLVDVLASLYGVARFGASRSGVIASFVGGLVGLIFLSLPGLFLGAFLGAVGGEYFLAKKDLNTALKAGVGSIVGFLAGSVIKLVLSLIMVAVFIFKVWL